MTLSFSTLAPVLVSLTAWAPEGLQIAEAEALAAQTYARVDPDRGLLIAGVSGRDAAARVARALLPVYGPAYEIVLLAAGRQETLALNALATGPDWGEETCVFVPALPRPGAYTALQDVIARLRAPDGCPWDRELTWDKLRPFLLEETYELLAALDAEDPVKVAEEQGDLLLQIALQTQIAIEENKYRSADVIAGIVEKLIRRHPHVFGDTVVSGTDEVLANWEAIKRTEREQNGEKKRSPLGGIPVGLPALAQAQAYLDRVARLETIETPDAPWTRLAEAAASGADVTPEMVGRALFGLVAWARARGIDAESALRSANARYAEGIND